MSKSAWTESIITHTSFATVPKEKARMPKIRSPSLAFGSISVIFLPFQNSHCVLKQTINKEKCWLPYEFCYINSPSDVAPRNVLSWNVFAEFYISFCLTTMSVPNIA
jgi:hypothetical protein